ncbi:MAG: preprotein translocase subunit SecY, partial [Thermoplasmata archaeon]
LSSALVAILAVVASLIGTVGATTGTGVLLTVGIVIRLYEQIAREQAMEMHPVLRKFLGVE